MVVIESWCYYGKFTSCRQPLPHPLLLLVKSGPIIASDQLRKKETLNCKKQQSLKLKAHKRIHLHQVLFKFSPFSLIVIQGLSFRSSFAFRPSFFLIFFISFTTPSHPYKLECGYYLMPASVCINTTLYAASLRLQKIKVSFHLFRLIIIYECVFIMKIYDINGFTIQHQFRCENKMKAQWP